MLLARESIHASGFRGRTPLHLWLLLLGKQACSGAISEAGARRPMAHDQAGPEVGLGGQVRAPTGSGSPRRREPIERETSRPREDADPWCDIWVKFVPRSFGAARMPRQTFRFRRLSLSITSRVMSSNIRHLPSLGSAARLGRRAALWVQQASPASHGPSGCLIVTGQGLPPTSGFGSAGLGRGPMMLLSES